MAVIVPIVSKFDDKGIKQAQSQFGAFGASMKKLVGGAIAAASLGAIVSTLNDAGKAAAADAKSQALLATQLKTTAGASDQMIASVESQIQALSQMAGVADDDIRPAFAQLVRATGDVGSASALTATALDVAAAKGISVSQAATALGKAAQGSTGALQKLGINVQGVADPLAAVQAQFKGAAEAAGNANPYQRLSVILDNLKETLGAAVLPLVSAFADAIVAAQPILDAFFAALKPVFAAIKPLIEKLTPIITKIIATLGNLLSALLPPILQVVDALLTAFSPIIDVVLQLIEKLLPPLTTLLTQYVVPAIQAWADAMSQPGGYIENLVTLLGDSLFMALQLINEYLGFVKEGFDLLSQALAPLIQGFMDWADSMGIDFGQFVQNLNPAFIALNALQLLLASVIFASTLWIFCKISFVLACGLSEPLYFEALKAMSLSK